MFRANRGGRRAHARTGRAFTLIELLVVVAVIGVIVGLLLPALSGARRSAQGLKCLSNVRSLEVAHALYMNDNRELFIDVGLPHGGSEDPTLSWVNTLSEYYGTALVVRSPGDRSPYWPVEAGGQGLLLSGTFRRTSYGMNNWLSRTYNPAVRREEPYDRLSKVQTPHATVQFLLMAEEGSFAVSDHTHAENWDPGPADAPPALASAQVETHAWGGKAKSWDAVSNYGYLDGHAEARRFRRVFTNRSRNQFDPAVAQ